MMSEQGVNGSSKKTNEKQSRVVEYLSKLGLDEADLAKVSRLLETINSQPAPESPSLHSASAVESDGFELGGILEMQPEDLMRMLMNGDTHVAEEPAGDTVHPQMGPGSIGSQAIKLFVAEEQMVLKEAYNSYFNYSPSFEAMGFIDGTSEDQLRAAISQDIPQVLLLGLKSLDYTVGKKLEMIREVYPQTGLVLLFACYDPTGAKALRESSSDSQAGYAYLLKHNIDTADQLGKVVQGVAQRGIIVDPEIMEDLVDSATQESQLLLALSPKEMQVLSWLARGYTNKTIAEVLSRDTKAVERQVSSIYAKMHLGEGKDARVGSALVYLKATGMLPRV